MRVLAIDPGLTRCGIGVIDSTKMSLIAVGVLKSSPELPIEQRLLEIDAQIREWVALHDPDVIAIERVFSQANLRTVMGTAQVAGIALLAAAQVGKKVVMHTPSEVKAAVTGSGRAKKDQVAQMVQRILKLETIPKPVDATDALALAICHVWRGAGNDRVAAAVTKEKKRLLTLRGAG
ncbi:MAG: crossover junction endodeoxyribonuclease RuvC [Candidatus Nanopelagicaceae bacterium]|jgi:crossover junction endodeoxyribonuclease RuvC|nr:crossover junction endodeoxyribonuclease RuvC [Candidatus Nanopelagicaceae bacterium]